MTLNNLIEKKLSQPEYIKLLDGLSINKLTNLENSIVLTETYSKEEECLFRFIKFTNLKNKTVQSIQNIIDKVNSEDIFNEDSSKL